MSVSLFQPGYYGREVVKQVEESNLTGVSQTRRERLDIEGHTSGIGRDISGQVRTVGLDRSVM